MSKGYVIVFGAVAGLAFGAADYMQLRGRSGGNLSPAEYLSSIGDRRAHASEEKAAASALAERREIAPHHYLAAAPEGWERHDWSAELYERIAGPTAAPTAEEQALLDKIKASPMGGFLTSGAEASDHRNAATSYLYTRGDEVVMISARLKDPERMGRNGAIMGFAVANMASMTQETGFAVIKGVTFIEKANIFQAQEDKPGQRDRRHVSGDLGSRVMIEVDSRASGESVRLLLSGIDYDSLNEMLEEPLPGIGSEAPVLSETEEQLALDTTLAAMKEAKAGQREAAERRMMEALEPTRTERALLGLAGGAAQSLTTMAPMGNQARVEAATAPADSDTKIDEARVEVDEASGKPVEIKINRPGKRQASDGFGGGNFCRVSE